MNEIDKAEHMQAIKAFIIPVFMFIACLLGAAGTFLIREGYMVGWGFIAASGTVLTIAFVATVTFQNKLRARGLMQDQFDSPAPGYEEEFEKNSQSHSDSESSNAKSFNAESSNSQDRREKLSAK